LKSNIGKTAHLNSQEEKYLTYGMVLCLVTLTDLGRQHSKISEVDNGPTVHHWWCETCREEKTTGFL